MMKVINKPDDLRLFCNQTKQPMKYQNKKVAGVWIDHDHAYIIRSSDYKSNGLFEIQEKIKADHHPEHSGSEHTFHQKQAQEQHKFFSALTSHLNQADALYIFGPGKAQEQLRNYLIEDKQYKNKEIVTGTAQHQTPNQLIAQVREHFYHN
ncbi:MAG: hypothetical protein ACK5AS_01060 [Bacteroidota bacterium]|jgi:stalled ribosome rescue protein Dom34|nr:hypothetical protein [Bacteroidota bacterium]